MIKKYLLLLLMLFKLLIGNAQPKQLCFEHLNVRNGLPSDYVGQILQDENGYMWFNTGTLLSRYDGYKFKVYKFGTEQNEGIADNGVFFDRQKRLWVGTDHGNLYRMDGARDTLLPERIAFNKGQEPGYAFFFSDKLNKIWLLHFSWSRASFLEQYNPNTKKIIRFNASQKGNEFLDSGRIMTLPFVTRTGNIFIGSNNGFYEYNSKKGNFEHYLNSPDSLHRISVVDVAETKNDSSVLWLLTKRLKEQQFTLYLFNGHDKTVKACASFKGTAERFYKSLYEDKKGRLWLAFKEGLYQYNRQTNDTAAYPFPPSDKSAKEKYYTAEIKVDDREGNLWLGTSFGVVYFNTRSGQIQRYMANPSDPDALAHNHVKDIFEDRSGLIWVGMDEYGVDRVNNLRSSFRTLRYNSLQAGSYPENTTGLAQKPDGNYWVTSQQGLFEWDTKKNYFKKIKLGKKDENQFTGDPFISKNDSLYFNLQGSVSIYSRTGKLESFKVPGSNDGVGSLFDDSDKAIWVLTYWGKLYKFDPVHHSFNLYSFVDASGKNFNLDTTSAAYPFTFYEDRQGTLWLSTSQAGLCRIDRAKKTVITSHSLQDGIFKNIDNIYEDAEGNFWLGTYKKGLWLFDRKSGKLINQILDKEGVLSEGIAGIAEDKSGNLWVSTERGLTKINLKHNTLFNYTVTSSIPFDAPVGLNYSLTKTSSGEFLLCMFNSLMRFNPDEIKPNTIPPVVQIESIVYSNPRSKQPDEHHINVVSQTDFRLPYYHNRITFNYVGLHYVNASQNEYAYKLDGFDKDWVQAGAERKVTYNNLDPGTYTFHVKAANSDGVWSAKDKSLTVIISPPWWKTWGAYLLFALLVAAVMRGYIVYRSRALRQENRRLEQKVAQRTHEVEQQKEEIESQRDNVEQALTELKATQAQLIQSEKMASLGELTAGIAHEIQNPLNFVNNFSEVNKELISELVDEVEKGNTEEVKLIANDIKANEEKINHHGKRADAIVKGMLQHSGKSEGKKEPTDINILCDEYLRLSYHGLHAKDKNFNVDIKTDFDETIGNINIVRQDIGRVLLNLFNNAFYAVNEKQKTYKVSQDLIGLQQYQPTVSIQTKRINDKVELIVCDNGNGIPQNIIDKIFQPFFTTKPTGQGTGLGLSLSYDIITKEHNGTIKVESPPAGRAGKENEGSKFIIQLPIA